MSPTLPGYNAKQNINPMTPGPLRHEAAQSFKDDQKVLGTLGDIAQKWSDANDVMQYTEAKAKYGTNLLEIQSRAAMDPDFKNSDKYFKEIADARSESTKGIDNQQVATKAGIEFEHQAQVAKIKIDSDFKEKQVAYNRDMVGINLGTMVNNRINSTTDAEAKQHDLEISHLLDANIQTGAISVSEAQQSLYKAYKKTYEDIVYSSPQRGIAVLKDDQFLSPEDKHKLIADAHQIEKSDKEFQEWQLKQTQTQGAIDLSDALFNKTLNPSMVRDMQQQGLIDSETAAIFDSLAVHKKYDIPESTSLAQPEYFLRLLDDSHGDKTQVNKVLKDAAEAYGNGKIGVNQYLYFVQNAKETFDRQSKGIFTKSSAQDKFMSAMGGIKEFFDNMSSDKKEKKKGFNEAVSEFSDRYKQGDDPQKIKNEILNQHTVKTKPEIENYPANGKLMVDKNGNKALVFPDGHYEEVK